MARKTPEIVQIPGVLFGVGGLLTAFSSQIGDDSPAHLPGQDAVNLPIEGLQFALGDQIVQRGDFPIRGDFLPNFRSEIHRTQYRIDADQFDAAQNKWKDGGVQFGRCHQTATRYRAAVVRRFDEG